MDLTNFEQYFYRDPAVESITTGGNFLLLDITDDEKRRAEEFIHVCVYFLALNFSLISKCLEKWCEWFGWLSLATIRCMETTSIRYRRCWIEV